MLRPVVTSGIVRKLHVAVSTGPRGKPETRACAEAHTSYVQILLEEGFAEDGCIAVTQPRRVVRQFTPNTVLLPSDTDIWRTRLHYPLDVHLHTGGGHSRAARR